MVRNILRILRKTELVTVQITVFQWISQGFLVENIKAEPQARKAASLIENMKFW
jgi:hypothetical protein